MAIIWGTGTEDWSASSLVIWGQDAIPTSPENQPPLVGFDILQAPTLDETTQQLSQHLPQGDAWATKLTPGEPMNALLVACAVAFNQVQQQIERTAREYNINLSVDLLPEWEESVGLPDECTSTLATLEERRANIIFRLRRIPIVTKAEFETLGTALAGVPVTVTPGAEVDAVPDSQSRFKLYVGFAVPNTGFEYDFAYPLGGHQSAIVACIFNKIVPANVVVIL